MEALKSIINDNPHLTYCVAAGCVVVTSIATYRLLFGRRRLPKEVSEAPSNTVVLFQFKRGPYAPSLSPFPMKLETYLRMAKIPYENNFKGTMSSKGKTPWMAYNGEIVADSQFCIEYLNEKRGVDLNKHLNTEEKAIAKSFQIMVDEHLYWSLVYFRWVHDKEKKEIKQFFKVPGFLMYFISRKVKGQVWSQGMGRHTSEEILHITMKCLQTISDFLGSKRFIMGDMPCETDCSIFGHLAQLEWQQKDGVLKDILQEKFPTLHSYCLRMRETFWKDWDDILPKTKQ